MKRRTFIALAGASALATPFLVKQIAGRPSKTPIAADRRRKRLDLTATADEQKVLNVLQASSKGVYLLGGCVIGKVQKRDLAYVNLLVESENFAQIKNDLFKLGVEPVSTPELPASVIRFGFAEKSYSVVNLPLNDFLKQNVPGTELGLIPFAHNFLVYSFTGGWVIDPYAALSAKATFSKANSIRVLEQPASPVAGLEYAIAASLDMAMLGLKESAACSRLTDRSLKQTVSADEAPTVVEHVINYVPDVLESSGFAAMRRFLVSPLCVDSARTGAGIDLKRVVSELDAIRKSGTDVTGTHLIGALNKEFLAKKHLDGLGFGLSDYMATKGFMVRRTDLLMAAMKTSRAIPQAIATAAI